MVLQSMTQGLLSTRGGSPNLLGSQGRLLWESDIYSEVKGVGGKQSREVGVGKEGPFKQSVSVCVTWQLQNLMA